MPRTEGTARGTEEVVMVKAEGELAREEGDQVMEVKGRGKEGEDTVMGVAARGTEGTARGTEEEVREMVVVE